MKIICKQKRVIKKFINLMFYKFFCIFPVKNNQLVFESDGDCSDNSYALFDYIKKHNLLGKYQVTWLVNNKSKFCNTKNVVYVNKYSNKIDILRSYKLAICKYYFYDHVDVIDYERGYRKRKKQRIIFLTHGAGFKAASAGARCVADEVYSPGKLFYYPISSWCNCDINKMIDIGYPRNDYFFQSIDSSQIIFKREFKLESYSKIFLWMPTFRRSIKEDINEEYFDSKTGLPIIEDEKSLEQFNDNLQLLNGFCFFKIHHLQAGLHAFNRKYSNIVVIDDEKISTFGMQLYQFIALTDVLITDYSSVSTDFMLLDRPIIYTMNDYEEYRNSRGFSIDDPKVYFAGYHIYNKEQLTEALTECVCGKDIYQNDRKKIISLMHSHIDGNSSKRILEHLSIS